MAETIAKRPVGSSGILVSVLGLGTVKFGRNTGVKNKTPDGFKLPDNRQIQTLLSLCLEQGVNLIDTAPAYGNAEERLGDNLGTNRSHFFISTKVGEEFDGQNSTYDFSAEHIKSSVERSLRRLKTSELDAVLLHLPRNDEEILKTTAALEALSALKKAGKIRLIGASTHTIAGGFYALPHCDLLMVPFNPGYQEHLPVIQLAEKLQKGIFIKKGLNSGFLNDSNPEDALKECFRSALQHKAITALIAGTINPLHLKQNIELISKLTEAAR